MRGLSGGMQAARAKFKALVMVERYPPSRNCKYYQNCIDHLTGRRGEGLEG